MTGLDEFYFRLCRKVYNLIEGGRHQGFISELLLAPVFLEEAAHKTTLPLRHDNVQ